MTGGQALTYCCAPGIVWAKDTGQTILVEQQGERIWILRDVEAAVWDLLTLGYRFGSAVRFLSVFLQVPAEDAGSTLLTILKEWEGAGIVRATGGSGCG
jgi:hypothetical protein